MSFFGFCQTFNIQILKQRKNIRQIELFCYNVNLLSRVFEKKVCQNEGISIVCNYDVNKLSQVFSAFDKT